MKKSILLLLVVVLSISMASMIGLAGCKEKAAEEVVEEEVAEEVVEEEVAEEEVAEEVVEEEVAEEEVAEEKVWKIGFNNYADSHEFCAKVHQGIEEAGEEYGVEIIYTEALMDGAVMISNTQTLIDKGVDLIIDFNWVPEIGLTMLEMCQEAGVELISMDAIYEGAYYFGAIGKVAGKILGEHVEEVVLEKWNGEIDAVVGLIFFGGGDNVLDRVYAVQDHLVESENIQFRRANSVVFDVESGDQTQRAKNFVTDYLTAHPDFKHILFVANNDETGLGAFAGVEASGRQEDCFIVSHGGDTPFHEHVRGGGGDVWIASISYAPESYGSYVIPLAIDILEGKDVPMSNPLGHVVLTKDNLDEYYPQ